MNTRIEAIVRRLFTDGDFRKAAIEDTDATLAQYKLSDAERRSVSRVCMGLATADGPSLSQRETALTWY